MIIILQLKNNQIISFVHMENWEIINRTKIITKNSNLKS